MRERERGRGEERERERERERQAEGGGGMEEIIGQRDIVRKYRKRKRLSQSRNLIIGNEDCNQGVVT